MCFRRFCAFRVRDQRFAVFGMGNLAKFGAVVENMLEHGVGVRLLGASRGSAAREVKVGRCDHHSINGRPTVGAGSCLVLAASPGEGQRTGNPGTKPSSEASSRAACPLPRRIATLCVRVWTSCGEQAASPKRGRTLLRIRGLGAPIPCLSFLQIDHLASSGAGGSPGPITRLGANISIPDGRPIRLFWMHLPYTKYKGVLRLAPYRGIRPIRPVFKRRCMIVDFFHAVMRHPR